MGPLFDAKDLNRSALDDDAVPVKRLPFWYNINHFYYYERRNFNLYVCTEVRGHIPGRSLSYGYTARKMYPWYWAPYVYWNLHWEWYALRIQLPGDSPYPLFLSRTGIFFILIGCLGLLATRPPSGAWFRKTLRALQIFYAILPVQLSAALGLAFAYLVAFCSVPPYLHPQYAVVLFIAYHSLAMLAVVYLADLSSTASAGLRFCQHCLRISRSVLCLCTVYVMTADIWTNPVSAAIGPLVSLFLSILIQYSILKDCVVEFHRNTRGKQRGGTTTEAFSSTSYLPIPPKA